MELYTTIIDLDPLNLSGVFVEELNFLNPGEYLIKPGLLDHDELYLHIVADTVSLQEVTYTCPFCWRRYKRDGTPHKNAERVVHIHASTLNIGNKVHPRVVHCDSQGFNKTRTYHEVRIYVTDKTIRI